MDSVVETINECDMFKFRNTKLVSQEDLDLLKSLGNFIMEKFFTEYKRANMTVNIIFVEDLYKKSNMLVIAFGKINIIVPKNLL